MTNLSQEPIEKVLQRLTVGLAIDAYSREHTSDELDSFMENRAMVKRYAQSCFSEEVSSLAKKLEEFPEPAAGTSEHMAFRELYGRFVSLFETSDTTQLASKIERMEMYIEKTRSYIERTPDDEWSRKGAKLAEEMKALNAREAKAFTKVREMVKRYAQSCFSEEVSNLAKKLEAFPEPEEGTSEHMAFHAMYRQFGGYFETSDTSKLALKIERMEAGIEMARSFIERTPGDEWSRKAAKFKEEMEMLNAREANGTESAAAAPVPATVAVSGSPSASGDVLSPSADGEVPLVSAGSTLAQVRLKSMKRFPKDRAMVQRYAQSCFSEEVSDLAKKLEAFPEPAADPEKHAAFRLMYRQFVGFFETSDTTKLASKLEDMEDCIEKTRSFIERTPGDEWSRKAAEFAEEMKLRAHQANDTESAAAAAAAPATVSESLSASNDVLPTSASRDVLSSS